MPLCYTRGDGSAVITEGGAAPLCYNRGVGSTVIPGGAAERFHDITAAPAAVRNCSSPDPSLITAESAPRLYLGGAAPPSVITAETAPRLYRGGPAIPAETAQRPEACQILCLNCSPNLSVGFLVFLGHLQPLLPLSSLIFALYTRLYTPYTTHCVQSSIIWLIVHLQ